MKSLMFAKNKTYFLSSAKTLGIVNLFLWRSQVSEQYQFDQKLLILYLQLEQKGTNLVC